MDPSRVSAIADVVLAGAAVCTLVVAVTAVFFARGQLKEARTLRREQAQPYVTVSMERSAASSDLIDLVIKNLGTTAAFDVDLVSEPVMTRGADGDRSDVWPGAKIPTLVPGQEWRTFWDTTYRRLGQEAQHLANRHQVTVEFNDSRGDSYQFASVLDWDVLRGRQSITERGVHDAAEALRAINKEMEKWTEGSRDGLKVVTRDGEAKDARRAAHYQRMRAAEQDSTDDHS